MNMVTFYEIVSSLQFSQKDGTWINFINDQDNEKDKESYHLVRFELETGKKHQLRVGCALAFGAPIVGDFKYGYDSQKCSTDLLRRSFKYTKLQERKLFQDSILLHSSKLTIPIDTKPQGKYKTFNSDITDPESNVQSAQTFTKVLIQLGLL